MNFDEIMLGGDKDAGQRKYQQDEIWFGNLEIANGATISVGIVADGVGGSDVGEKASWVAINEVKRQLIQGDEEPKQFYRAMVRAIESANTLVLETFQGKSNSTIVVAVIVDDGTDYGRLFIAHVGDSIIYLVRGERDNRRLTRMNTDHTIENEFHLKNEEVPAWVYQDPKNPPSSLSRALGQKQTIQVDVGIYISSNVEELSTEKAHRQGLKGLLLKEGDTILLSSDGLFSDDPNNPGECYLSDEAILSHSLDEDVQKAAITLLGEGVKRGLPGTRQDNLSIVLMFLPGDRKNYVATALPLRTIIAISVFTAVIAIALVISLFSQRQTTVNAQTQQAIERVTAEFLEAIANVSDTPLPELPPTATPTNTPSPTPSPTPTQRPSPIAPDQIGLLFYPETNERAEILEDNPIIFLLPAFAALEGISDRTVPNQSNVFGFPNTDFVINDIETDLGRESLEFEINLDTNVFIEAGSFATGGINFEFSNYNDLEIQSRSACLTITDSMDTITFGCYGDSCSYQLQNEDDIAIATSNIVEFMPNADGDMQLTSSRQIEFLDTFPYYNLIENLGYSPPQCVLAIVNPDGDDFLNDGVTDQCPDEPGEVVGCPDIDEDGFASPIILGDTTLLDLCPAVAGPINGCPRDSDRDGVLDNNDRCPNVFGDADNAGCPRDSDSDGIFDRDDNCPNIFGVAENGGCPLPTATPRGSR